MWRRDPHEEPEPLTNPRADSRTAQRFNPSAGPGRAGGLQVLDPAGPRDECLSSRSLLERLVCSNTGPKQADQ